jgi:hypothetical protein
MADMSDNPSTGSAASPDPEPGTPPPARPDAGLPPDDVEYLVTSGEAVGDDGSVVEIIGGLPAVEGSAWDIGAPLEDRGTIPDDERDNP